MENIFIRPTLVSGEPDGGKRVHIRDPHSRKPLDPGGEWKPLDDFWRRRVRDKDVEGCAPPHQGDAAVMAEGAAAAVATHDPAPPRRGPAPPPSKND